MTTATLEPFKALMDTVAGRTPDAAETSARRTQLITYAALSTIVLSAIWGLAAGSATGALGTANLYKVPAIVLLSGLSAIPAGLLVAYFTNASVRPSDLLLSYATSIFAGTLVLAVLSPLVAVYYHTSAWAGPVLGLGSAFLGISAGTVVFLRVCMKRVRDGQAGRGGTLASVATFTGVKLAMMLQLIAIMSPILPQTDAFDGGIDTLVVR